MSQKSSSALISSSLSDLKARLHHLILSCESNWWISSHLTRHTIQAALIRLFFLLPLQTALDSTSSCMLFLIYCYFCWHWCLPDAYLNISLFHIACLMRAWCNFVICQNCYVQGLNWDFLCAGSLPRGVRGYAPPENFFFLRYG